MTLRFHPISREPFGARDAKTQREYLHARQEPDGGRLVRIVLGKLQEQLEGSSFPGGVVGPEDHRLSSSNRQSEPTGIGNCHATPTEALLVPNARDTPAIIRRDGHGVERRSRP